MEFQFFDLETSRANNSHCENKIFAKKYPMGNIFQEICSIDLPTQFLAEWQKK